MKRRDTIVGLRHRILQIVLWVMIVATARAASPSWSVQLSTDGLNTWSTPLTLTNAQAALRLQGPQGQSQSVGTVLTVTNTPGTFTNSVLAIPATLPTNAFNQLAALLGSNPVVSVTIGGMVNTNLTLNLQLTPR